MIVKSESGVWMHDVSRGESVARMIAIDCMMAIGLDHVNDFKTRDKIIVAISDRINRALDKAAGDDIYRRAMESMASQFIHPKITALEMARMQLGINRVMDETDDR